MKRLIILSILILLNQYLFSQTTGLVVETYTLENGLTVYLNEDKTASNVYGAVWVNAGGKNDPADATGMAHYLEHMLFKGTEQLGTQNYSLEKTHLDSIRLLYDQLALTTDKNRKTEIQKLINEQELKAARFAIPNEFDKLVKSFGSTGVNAGTSEDYTLYYNFFPANQLPKWLDIYAHRFQQPVFRLFQSELETVYEEKNRAGDDLERRVQEKFNEYIYGDHPYSSQTVLGSVEHLKNPSLSKMYQYFEDYYVANNMALVLTGNFNADYAKPLIEKTFGKLKRGTVPSFPEYTSSKFEGRVVEKVRITPIKAGFMGYKLVPNGHPDQPALEVIANMISNESSTGFIDKMYLNNEVLYAGAYSEFLEDDGSTFIFYVPKVFGKSLKKFETQIKGSFQDIVKGNFTEEYFASIKYGIYRNFNLSLERLASRGRYLGLSFIYGLDYQDFLAYPEKVQQLTKEDIKSVAAKYYGEDYFTMQSRTGFPKKPKLKKPSFKPINSRTEAVSAYAEKFEKLPEQKAEPTFIDFDRDTRCTDEYLYYTHNPLNDVFTLTLSIAKGLVQDESYPLLAYAINNAGTTTYSPVALKNEFAKLGATYSVSAGYGNFEIKVTGLDQQFDATLALVEQVLTEFNPSKQTIDLLYNQRRTQNKINKNDPATGGSMLYVYGLFGDNSSYKRRIPAEKLKAMAPDVLKTKLTALIASGFNTIHYVGQKDQKTIGAAFTSNPLFKKNTTDHYTFLEAKPVSENTIYIINDKKAIQSYVYYIVNGEPLDYEKNYMKNAFNAYYTNSLSGLLFQEVREFRSLAYSTGGSYIDPAYEPEKRGRLVLFTGSQGDKTADAVGVVMGMLTDMPVYESRTDGIKNGLILQSSSSKPNFRDLSENVDALVRSGYTKDPNEINYSKYQQLTFEDIESFYAENIKGKPVTITIYGDASRFDKEKLKQYGRVIELTMKDIVTE